jgi:hypothetical protein
MIMLKFDKLYLAEGHQSACQQLPACDAVYAREFKGGGGGGVRHTGKRLKPRQSEPRG